MQLKIIEIVAPRGHADTLAAIAAQAEATDCTIADLADPDLVLVRILCGPDARQAMVDRIQTVLSGAERWRLSLLPVDATLPAPCRDQAAAEAERRKATTATREELYTAVSAGAAIDSNFLIFIAVSTIVAALGLTADNVAVIIGAMVIAPLLGPSLAFALATALGDRALLGRALRTGALGLGLAIALSALLTTIVPVPPDSVELQARTGLGYDGVALALASGAAAALSLTAGLSTTLVGVMVAVALLPPAATAGLMLGIGAIGPALGALMLLAVNLIALNLMGQVVFLMKGIRPHRWLERSAARQSVGLSIAMSLALLAAVVALIAASR
ncbi:MAG TPA: TIGR00341 family protein [Pseudohaliea sp.]|nr:TIGR00341 family protein [Pseudohaliea sp.]